MVRVGAGAALAPCCSAAPAHLRPASSFFLSRQARPVVLSWRSSLFLSSRLRVRRHCPKPYAPRVFIPLVRAEAREDDAESPESASVNGDGELEDEGPWEATSQPPEDDSDSDFEEEEERTGPISWLKNKFRRKTKEELEAEQAEKSSEVLEVCICTLPLALLKFVLSSP